MRTDTTPADARSSSPGELATGVTALARRLLGESIRDDGGARRWIGDEVDVAASVDGVVLRSGPVDDGLLTGRAGIALALAAAARIAQDAALAAVAVQTIDDILAADLPGSGLGWQSGALGIATAAERIGGLLDRPAIAHRGALVAERAVTAIATDDGSRLPPYADLLDGSAGHLMAVLSARLPATATPMRRAAAVRLVADLRARAEVDELGARWPMAGGDRAVSGMAHGSSGIALALAAAQAAGVPGAEGDLASSARAWDDAWYVEEEGGWYDLRIDEPVIGAAWCHGAPGIGIAAASGAQLGHDTQATYLRAVRSVDAGGVDTADATLCHGRGGFVELRLAGAEAWPVVAGEHLRDARAEASWIVDGIAADGSTSWHHGVPGGSSPTLLDGTAGVILTLARCIDPAFVAGVTHPGLPAQSR